MKTQRAPPETEENGLAQSFWQAAIAYWFERTPFSNRTTERSGKINRNRDLLRRRQAKQAGHQTVREYHLPMLLIGTLLPTPRKRFDVWRGLT